MKGRLTHWGLVKHVYVWEGWVIVGSGNGLAPISWTNGEGDQLKWNFNHTVYPKKYAHGFCFAVLCCGYTLTDFPISIRLTSLALWQSNDCPSASKATLMNMDKYFMWIHYERLHNHNKAKHNKTVCIFLGIYCRGQQQVMACHPFNGLPHDDNIKWKHFPRYWLIVSRIHQSLVDSPKKRPVMLSFNVFFDLHLNRQLSK